MSKILTPMTITIIYLTLVRLALAIATPLTIFSLGTFIDILVLIALFMPVALIGRRWIQKTIYGTVAVFFTLLAIADAMFHSYFGMFTTRASTQGLTFMTPELTTEYDLAILPAFGLFFLVVGAFLYILIKCNQSERVRPSHFGFWVFLIFAHLLMLWNLNREDERFSLEYYQTDTFLYNENIDNVTFSSTYGYFYYHLLDLFRLPERHDEDAIVDAILDHFSAHNRTTNAYTGLLTGANVIHITVESLDTRFIDETISPTLYAMMQDGIIFDQFHVPVVNQGATCNSEFMAITGLHATVSSPWSNNVCHTYRNTSAPYSIPSQLSRAGYATFYFHSGFGHFYHRETLMPNLGFEHVKFVEDLEAEGITDYNVLLDTDMVHFFDAFMTYDEPFYVHLLTYALHGGYQPAFTDHWNDLIDSVHGDDIDPEVRVYLQKLAEFDLFMRMLLDRLDGKGVKDNTLIVMHTDHYPFMLPFDAYEDFTGIDVTSTELYKQSLLFYHPSLTPETISTLGATIDIAPSILNLLEDPGNPFEYRYFFGEDLFGEGQGAVLLGDLSVYDGNRRIHRTDNDLTPQEEALLEHMITRYLLSRHTLRFDVLRTLFEAE